MVRNFACEFCTVCNSYSTESNKPNATAWSVVLLTLIPRRVARIITSKTSRYNHYRYKPLSQRQCITTSVITLPKLSLWYHSRISIITTISLVLYHCYRHCPNLPLWYCNYGNLPSFLSLNYHHFTMTSMWHHNTTAKPNFSKIMSLQRYHHALFPLYHWIYHFAMTCFSPHPPPINQNYYSNYHFYEIPKKYFSYYYWTLTVTVNRNNIINIQYYGFFSMFSHCEKILNHVLIMCLYL